MIGLIALLDGQEGRLIYMQLPRRLVLFCIITAASGRLVMVNDECTKGELEWDETGAYGCLMVTALCQKEFVRESKTRARKER